MPFRIVKNWQPMALRQTRKFQGGVYGNIARRSNNFAFIYPKRKPMKISPVGKALFGVVTGRKARKAVKGSGSVLGRVAGVGGRIAGGVGKALAARKQKFKLPPASAAPTKQEIRELQKGVTYQYDSKGKMVGRTVNE